jgi:hypothetical protein
VENILEKEYSIANFLFFLGEKISQKGKHLFENDKKIGTIVCNMKECA